jgi:hypothetical protein
VLEEKHPEAVDVGHRCVQERRGGEVQEEHCGKEARERRLLLVESSGRDKVVKTCGTRELSGRAKVVKMCHARFGLRMPALRVSIFSAILPASTFDLVSVVLSNRDQKCYFCVGCFIRSTLKIKFIFVVDHLTQPTQNSIFGVGCLGRPTQKMKDYIW